MDDGPGWLPDPEHEDQERYWDGSAWTDQVRPVGSPGSLRLPEHVPELQRALAAATADIDKVEDRLSSLFERTGDPAGAGAVHRPPAEPPAPPEPAPHEEFEDDFEDDVVDEGGGEDSGEDSGEGEDEDGAFAELDAALAAEAPDKPERRFFRRRSS